MERTRFIRRPLVWIILMILVALLLGSLFTGDGDYKKVNTSVALAQVTSGNYTKAQLEDKEQVLRLSLKHDYQGSKKIEASFPAEASDDIFTMLSAKASDSGPAFDTKVTQESIFVTLLITVLPILVVVVLLFLFMSQCRAAAAES